MSSPEPASATASESGPARGPEGSGYDAAHRRRPSRKPSRRLRGWLSWHLVGLVAWLFPYLYYAYCWLVWKSVRHDDQLREPILSALAAHGGVVTMMWHEEVFPSAFAYGPLQGDALASTSNFGRVITRMLEVCGCNVFRGGSSQGRRRRQVLPELIRYMNEAPRCLYGLTVDGSRGPVYRVKSGGLVIARECGAPIYLVRTWFSRNLRVPSWDRTAIPLPFGTLQQYALGPYWVPPDAGDEELEALRAHLEHELQELADHSLRRCEGERAERAPRPGFPEGWEPRWAPGQLGQPYGPHDLDPERPPPWAKRNPALVQT